uniref:Uncharacterized protein n=2 Tax=Vitrella brassicaformis TaxID=1169539 RepID=A0A7S1KCB6_9ALVE
MLRSVEAYTQVLHDTCRFGVDEHFLKTAYVSLNSLLTLRFHSDDILQYGMPVAKPAEDDAEHFDMVLSPSARQLGHQLRHSKSIGDPIRRKSLLHGPSMREH